MSEHETIPAPPEEDTSECPTCRGVPHREVSETNGDDVTFLITECHVCEHGRVSREFARAWWDNSEPAA